jgi:predicted nuclease of predicted toxin-antitoxin system
MKVKLDENMPGDLVDWLRSAGHDAETAAAEGLLGAVDADVLAVAASERRVLLTFDVGLGDLRRYPLGTHAGIVVFRVSDHRWQFLRQRAQALLASLPPEHLAGALVVVDDRRIRYRGPSSRQSHSEAAHE